MIRLIKAQITLYLGEDIKRNLPPLVNADNIGGNKAKIYGDAGLISGEANKDLEGDATNKRGILSKDLWGNWSDITGDISYIWGNANYIEGDATGKKGDVGNIYGEFTRWRGDMSGIRGCTTGTGGDGTGITATIDEIKEVLKATS